MSKVAWNALDKKVVDATVDAIAHFFYNTGESTRHMHNGNLSTMLRLMTLGFIILLTLSLMLSVVL